MTEQKIAPGRPRSDASKTALINATFDILREVGYERMTMDAVAQRAGVGKATIYRWYANKDELLIEALSCKADHDEEPIPDTGSLVGDIMAFVTMRRARDPLAMKRIAVANTVSALAGNDVLAKIYWEKYLCKKVAGFADAFERAKKRGEIAQDADLDLFMDLYFGYMVFGLTIKPEGSEHFEFAALERALRHLVRAFSPYPTGAC